MSNKNKQKGHKPSASAAPEATAAPVVEVKAQMLFVVKHTAKLRGAREEWYKRLLEHDGKPVNDYIASCKEKPPMVPKSGRAENPTGWLSWFRREGIVEIRTAA